MIKLKGRNLPATWRGEQDKELAETLGRYAEIAELSDRVGVSETTLLARYHKAARMFPPEPKPPKDDKPESRFRNGKKKSYVNDRRERVAQLVDDGLDGPEIAERLRVNKATVYSDVKTLGLKLRSRY